MSSTSSSVSSAELSRFSSPAAIVIRKPGVQNPHCSAWHSRKASCTGCSTCPPWWSSRARPSTVVTDAPVDLDGEQQAGAHRLAVHQHRARAADAVLAADVRAGQPEVVAQRVGQQPAHRHAWLHVEHRSR